MIEKIDNNHVEINRMMKKNTSILTKMKTYISSFIFALIIATSLISCESYKHISVIVIDEVTGEPIDSVFVKVNAGKDGDYNKNYDEGYTDISGKFETNMMIGCSFGCYDIYMEYSKKGYETKTDLNLIEGSIFLKQK